MAERGLHYHKTREGWSSKSCRESHLFWLLLSLFAKPKRLFYNIDVKTIEITCSDKGSVGKF